MRPSARLLSAALLSAFAAVPAPAAELVAPYVNTPREDVELMLEMAGAGAGDYLIDLGAGDGRIVITAALRGAMGHGVELDRELVALAREQARAAEVDHLVAFRHGDVFEADLSGATIVTMYLMPEVNLRLRPRLLAALPPGTRVLSNSFDMGDWRPDRHEPARSSGGIMLWIVPADVAGDWQVDAGGRRLSMTIEQRFQDLEIAMRHDGTPLHVLHTTLDGARIAFQAGDGMRRYAFSGRVDGAGMAGVVQIHGVNETRVTRWQARRQADR